MNKMTKKIDEQLLRINNLHWLPWIGKNLKKIPVI